MNGLARLIGLSAITIGTGAFVTLSFFPFANHPPVVLFAVLAALSAICWFVAYLTFSAARAPQGNPVSQPDSGDWTEILRKLSLVMAVASGLVFGIHMLIQLGLVLQFIVIAPFVLLFPFSYMAYSAFQRPVRIKRLRSDFELLTAQWDEALYQQSTSFFNYALHIALAILVTLLGFVVLSNQPAPLDDLGLTAAVLRAMGFGFLGGFLFSAYYIYRRYTTSDLLPSVYLYCAITIVLGLILNFIAFRALEGMTTSAAATQSMETNSVPPGEMVPPGAPAQGNRSNGVISGMADLLSFAIGFFPILAVQWFTQVVYKALGRRQRRSDLFPLDQLDGISQSQEIRLRDFGIDDAQNLASAELPMILINTPFPVQTVVDWIDQAILMVLLNDSNALDNFRKAHVRTMTDFRDLWEPYVERQRVLDRVLNAAVEQPADLDKRIGALKDEQTAVANTLNSNPTLLNALYVSTNFDMNLHYLYNYRKNVELLLPGWASARYNRYLIEAYYCHSNGERKELARLWSFVHKYLEANDHIREMQKRSPEDDSYGAIVEPTSVEARIGLARLYKQQATASANGIRDIFEKRSNDEYCTAVEQIERVTRELKGIGFTALSSKCQPPVFTELGSLLQGIDNGSSSPGEVDSPTRWPETESQPKDNTESQATDT
jgi:hypothetical protein